MEDNCECPKKEYIRVLFYGCLAIFIIQAVCSFLTNVDIILVQPKSASYHIQNGIICYPHQTSIDDVFAPIIGRDTSEECNNIADTMANTATLNPEWQCEAYTDYTTKNIYNTFASWKFYWIALFILSVIYSVSAITHDWTLIYYKNNDRTKLAHVNFLPQTVTDFLFMNYLLKINTKIADFLATKNKCKRYCGFVIWSVIFIAIVCPLAILEIPLTHTIRPIIWYFQLKCNNTDQVPHTIAKFDMPIISYISASWVGLSRFLMGMTSLFILFFMDDGFSYTIRSYDAMKCYCECNYILPHKTYRKLLVTILLFVALNVLFLYSWVNETIHGHHSLYLIKYTLPIRHAYRINDKDCTGDMMRDPAQDMTSNEGCVYKRSEWTNISESDEEIDHKTNDADLTELDISNDGINLQLQSQAIGLPRFRAITYSKIDSDASFNYRLSLFVLSACALPLLCGQILFDTVWSNFYDLEPWLRVVYYVIIFVVMVPVSFVFELFGVYWLYKKRYNKSFLGIKEKSTSKLVCFAASVWVLVILCSLNINKL
eukprot:534539_1